MRANLLFHHEIESVFIKVKYQRKQHIYFQRCQERALLLKPFASSLHEYCHSFFTIEIKIFVLFYFRNFVVLGH